MRFLLPTFALLLAACAPPPAPAPKAPVDPVTESWYTPAIAELAAMNHNTEALLHAGKPDAAAAAITKAQPLAARLLTAPRPTLPAMEAASDLEQLYADMLLANKNYGWARLSFQKNLSRWKNRRPQTEGSARRLKQAQEGIAECDRRMGQ
jgi:hypothetical protein